MTSREQQGTDGDCRPAKREPEPQVFIVWLMIQSGTSIRLDGRASFDVTGSKLKFS